MAGLSSEELHRQLEEARNHSLVARLERVVTRMEVQVTALEKECLPSRMTKLESRTGWHEKIGALTVAVAGLFGKMKGWW